MFNQNQIMNRRNAVFETLRNFLQDEDLDDAMEIWENQYSKSQTVSINKFINSIPSVSKINGARTKLLIALTKALNVNIDSADNKVDSVYGNKETEKEIIIFEFLVKELISNLSEKTPEIKAKLSTGISEKLNKAELNSNEKDMIAKLISGDTFTLPVNIPFNAQKQVFHLLYARSCEVLGPVYTDKIISGVIQNAARLPEAKDISPKKWL